MPDVMAENRPKNETRQSTEHPHEGLSDGWRALIRLLAEEALDEILREEGGQ